MTGAWWICLLPGAPLVLAMAACSPTRRKHQTFILAVVALVACTAQAFVPPLTGSSPVSIVSHRGRLGTCVHAKAGNAEVRPPSKRKDPSPFDPLAMEKEKEKALAEVPQDNTIYKGLLLLVAVIWGSNFGALKYLDTCGVEVSVITAFRFALATLSLLPFLLKASKEVLFAGLEVGLWVSLGYITQAVGLETTEASKSAFICSLTVVLVPLIQGLLGRKISPQTWVACALAIVGVGLLTLQGKKNSSLPSPLPPTDE